MRPAPDPEHTAGERTVFYAAVMGLALLAPVAAGTTVLLTGSSSLALAGLLVVAAGVAARLVTQKDPDTATYLAFFVVVLLLLPSSLQTPALGSVGTPATLLAVGGAGLWVLGQVGRLPGLDTGWQPLRIALMCLFGVHLLSFGVAYTRALDLREASAANRGLVTTVALIGVALLATDGLSDRRRLDALLKALTLAGAGAALIGILQFTINYDFTEHVQIPGLSPADNGYKSIDSRSGFNRVSGAAMHAIEYSVLLAMVLPHSIHYAWTAGGRSRWLWWPALTLTVVALPMTVSRTAAVAVLAIAAVLIPTWPSRRRKIALALAAVFAIVTRALWPGLLGTIKALFFSAAVDPSVTARQGDYNYVLAFIGDRPLLGRGFGTFLPDRYDFLDNQYLMSLVETGAVGLLALLAVFMTGWGLGRVTSRSAADHHTRDMATSLRASLLVMVVSCATFDFLSFPSARMLGFLLVGCTAALWRIERAEAQRTARTGACVQQTSSTSSQEPPWTPTSAGRPSAGHHPDPAAG